MFHNRNIKEQTLNKTRILNERDFLILEVKKYQISFPKTIEKISLE